MDQVLGPGNGITQYLLVLTFYAALFVVMQHAHPCVELNFRRTYWILYFGWSVGVFVGNYVFHLLGIMSFLPWLNNFMHTFVWIGFCLGFLYAGCYRKPFYEQFVLFAVFSLVVKLIEHIVLGTWEMDSFFGIPGNDAYIVGWSLMDGLYPVLSKLGLTLVARFVRGVIVS
ncbi:MAG: hypothetical protein HW407_1665 [Bacteroidetes bacterium]|nr:hypothetical protein [Bacteroidota bacterium]